MSQLSIEGLRTYFHTRGGVVRAVDGVNLSLESGEAVGLVGESGAGKSTVGFSVMRLIPSPPGRYEGGRILFKDRDLLALSPAEMRKIRGREIAMVFQDPMTYLNPVLTVYDQIAEAVRKHQERTDVEKAVLSALELVGMPDARRVAESFPHQISGGMKQRVLIAIAVACHPSLIIADEPTTALDVTVQAQILDLIRELKQRLGTTLLLITHDLGIVAELCDRAYVMYAGQVVEHGSVYDLFEDARHPYTRGLLNSVLSIDEMRETLQGIPGSVPDLTCPPPGCRFAPRCPERMTKCSQPPPCRTLENGRQVYCWLYE